MLLVFFLHLGKTTHSYPVSNLHTSLHCRSNLSTAFAPCTPPLPAPRNSPATPRRRTTATTANSASALSDAARRDVFASRRRDRRRSCGPRRASSRIVDARARLRRPSRRASRVLRARPSRPRVRARPTTPTRSSARFLRALVAARRRRGPRGGVSRSPFAVRGRSVGVG